MIQDVLTIVAGVMQALQLPRPAHVVGNPDPQVGQAHAALVDAAAELVTRYPFRLDLTADDWLESADGLQRRGLPQLDTDRVLIEASLAYLATKWRFLEANGLDYAESFRAAEEKIARAARARTVSEREAAGHDAGKAAL